MSPEQEYAELGRVWFRNALNCHELNELGAFQSDDSGPGHRPNLSLLKQQLFSPNGQIEMRTSGLLTGKKPVRVIAFDKQVKANWAVPWHQDRIIAVKDKTDDQRFFNWTRQGTYWHCEPPIETFAKMAVIRIHFDDCLEDSGAMQLALKSHRLGKVPAEACSAKVDGLEVDRGIAKAGDVLVFHPLLVHRSKKAANPKRRRVLRIDYAPTELVTGLEWAIDAI